MARRFRPKSFDEVVGQGHVGQALQNAIRAGRVAHAYLFTGARGVGKTSTARIFAKALNCPNMTAGIPCNECEICQAIGAGNDVDVLEIDGASNRGIDDIRQLRANVGVRSMRSPFKVYIIDEVHMLTKEAFNALLKTLEEPPPNVKFVFCTTEPNKVPDTILSRCQRFDFGTIDQDSIAGRLRQIAAAEGKTVDDDAVELIARRANGSMRDSQSLFDQLLAFGGEQIDAEDVHQLLGTASDDRLLTLVDACIDSQPGTALELVEAALQQGVQTGGLTDQLLAYLRDLMVSAAGAKGVPLSAVTDARRDQVLQQSLKWGLPTISAAMQIVAETKSRLQRTTHGRALLELAVVRLATLEKLDQISTLLQSGIGSAPAAANNLLTSSAPRSGPLYQGVQVKKNSNGPAVASIPAANPAVPPLPASPAASYSPPAPAIALASEAIVSNIVASKPIDRESDPLTGSRLAAPVIALSEQTQGEFWTAILQKLTENHCSKLKNASRTAISGPNVLEIFFPKSYTFAKQYCERPEALKLLNSVASETAGKVIECRLTVDHLAAEVKVQAPSQAERPREVERMKSSAVDADAFVQMAVAVFGGQVVEVRPLLDVVRQNETEAPADDDPQEVQEDD